MTDLRGTVVLVSGASHGVAAQIARELGARGASVALLAADRDGLANVTAEITRAGGHALAVPGDPGDAGSVRAALSWVIGRWERLDVALAADEHADPRVVAAAAADYLDMAAVLEARPGDRRAIARAVEHAVAAATLYSVDSALGGVA